MKFSDSYVVIDIETTGFSPSKNEIIEIAAMKVDPNGEVTSFQTLIKPDNEIPDLITNLTGISNDMVKDAKNIKEALLEFDQFKEDYILIGHNVSFDIGFLDYYYKKHLDRSLVNQSIDTLALSRKYLPHLYNHKLDTIACYFNLNTENHHRALADVEMTLHIYNQIKDIAHQTI